MASGRARMLSVGVTRYKITVETPARFGSMAPGRTADASAGGQRFGHVGEGIASPVSRIRRWWLHPFVRLFKGK